MKSNINSSKLNIIITIMIWWICFGYALLQYFSVEGIVFYLLFLLTSIGVFFYLLKKYKPTIKNIELHHNYMEYGKSYLFEDDIINAYEVSPIGKIMFILKNPQCDYSTNLLKNGLLLKLKYGSILIDNVENTFVKYKKAGRIYDTKTYLSIYYLASIAPAVILITAYYRGLDISSYIISALMLAYIILLRIIPVFYLGRKIEHHTLPLLSGEYEKFKNITIIEGFALSDKLSVIPFTKPSYLDGLAIDFVFKKYIILNPRLFSIHPKEYLRFVLFHELCHIEHHDSSKVFIVCSVLASIDVIVSLLPMRILTIVSEKVPYYDYIISALITIYVVIVLIKRKSIEQRADKFGVQAIGNEGTARIYEVMGVNLTNPK